MDKITAIKIKQNDETYSDPIPVSVLGENVECNNNSLIDILGSIDIQKKGNIQYQLNQLFNTKVSISELNNYVYNNLEQTVTNWLENNIESGNESIVIDKSLSIEGAAADAKATTDTFYTKNEINQVITSSIGEIRWEIPQGTYDAAPILVTILNNIITINGQTSKLLRCVAYGSQCLYISNAPTYANQPDIYLSPITSFIPGHKIKAEINLISGSYTINGDDELYLDLRNIENNETSWLINDGQEKIIDFQPQIIIFGIRPGTYNNAIFELSIIDMTVKNQAAKNAISSISKRIDILHNSIQYWGEITSLRKVEGQPNSMAIYTEQNMSELILDGTVPSGLLRFKLSGGIARTNSVTTARSWIGTINLIKDHIYEIKIKLTNGHVTNIPETIRFVPLFSISNSVNQQGEIKEYENNINEIHKIVKWTLEETPATLMLQISGQGLTFEAASYQIILEDITGKIQQKEELDARLMELKNKTNNPFEIIAKNYNNETYYQAFSRTKEYHTGTNLIRFAHITDTHSDGEAWKRFLIYNQYIEPKVSAIMHTGDIVHHDLTDDYTYLTDNLSDILTFIAIGNHDVGNGTAIGSGGATNTECKQIFISPLIEKYGASKILVPNNENACYYYSDVKSNNENKTLRTIILNPYDYDENTNGQFVDRKHIHYSQNQIDWLIGVLQDANTNSIPICILAHQCDAFLGAADGLDDPFHMDYDNPSSQGAAANHKDWSGNPICDLVEAFITGSSLIQSYNEEEFSISINTSFSQQGHFVCWFTGHRHNDRVGFLPGYHQLNICLANGGMNVTATYSDLPRHNGTKSEDCFNLYSINLTTQTIGITRIGSDVTYAGIDRKKTLISYVKNE